MTSDTRETGEAKLRYFWRFAKDYLLPQWPLFIVAFISMLLLTASSLALPWIGGTFISKLLSLVSSPQNMSVVIKLVLLAILVSFLMAAFDFAQSYILTIIGQKGVYKLRSDLFSHILTLSLRFFTHKSTGTIIGHVINDIELIQVFIRDALIQIFRNLAIIIGTLAMMAYVDWRLFLIFLGSAPILILFNSKINKAMSRHTDKQQNALAKVISVISEVIKGVRVIKVFGGEPRERRVFDEKNREYYNEALRVGFILSLLYPAFDFIGKIYIVGVVLFGAYEIATGMTTVESFSRFILYVVSITHPLASVGRLGLIFQQAVVATNRIYSIFDMEPRIKSPSSPMKPSHQEGSVEYRKVRFAYSEQEEVLRGIDLEVAPGKVVAIVGPSGAGKTTMVSLLPRLYDVTSGSLRIDGVDVRDYDLKYLRSLMGIVPQETVIFYGTVAENIAYGKPDATMEEIMEAARIANAHEFIEKLPDGYNTLVGEGGIGLSGGQAQRIAIARAILRKPLILILDEATSNLDAESEKKIQEAMLRIIEKQTTFIVAHRLSTVREADLIVVLKDGRIVETGTHSELLSKNGFYAYLFRTQFGGSLI